MGRMAETQVAKIAQAASKAPSVHNTKPWRLAEASDRLDVHADPTRALHVLDPTGRQLHVSCGAAVEFAYLSARGAGRACLVTVLPDPHDSTLLARLSLGGDEAPTAREAALAAAIDARHTDRGAYSDEPVPAEVVDDAGRRAAELGGWLRRIERPDDRRTLIAVLADSEAAEAADPAYRDEIARWTRSVNSESEVGLSPEAVAPVWPTERVSDVPLRDFTGAARHPRPGDHPDAPAPMVERDLLLLIGTEYDEPGSWLGAGRVLGWTLLRATAAGVVAQPLAQAIDLQGGRERLRHELGLVGHVQFVLRLGVKS